LCTTRRWRWDRGGVLDDVVDVVDDVVAALLGGFVRLRGEEFFLFLVFVVVGVFVVVEALPRLLIRLLLLLLLSTDPLPSIA
jgi:hypothetical protein